MSWTNVDVSSSANVTVTLRHRDTPGASLTDTGPNAVDSDGMAHFTASCRYARAQILIAAGATWTHAQGIDIDASDDGVL